LGYWIKETKQYSPDDHIFCFINKCDKGDSTEIPQEQITFLEENGIKWFKVSAKCKFNVNEGIMNIAREVMKTIPKLMANQGPTLGLS